jgi:ATP-binding cassette subfamily C (CFTR/MRP) protein 1
MRHTLTCFSSDPQGTRTDAELISALQRAWLLPKDGKEDQASEAKFSLDSVVSEEGGNFSAGERQLVALCRALVKDTRIIVMVCTWTIASTFVYSLDRMKRPPTSMWRLIQRSKRPQRQNSRIGHSFALLIGSTPSVRSVFLQDFVHKVPYHLLTVYYDRVLVLDAGRVAEYDTPLALFDNEDSIFRSLCREAGLNRADIVRIRSAAGAVREE